jgi:hypothetical protein
MIFFGEGAELIDKVRFWLAPERDTARAELRQAARRRAENEHTWLHRFQAVGTKLGLSF